eukprot:1153558-Pelagomonas_calceolata.AAC.1
MAQQSGIQPLTDLQQLKLCQAHFPPAASVHPTSGYEMVAPKLRPDKAQHSRQQQFQATNSSDGQLVRFKMMCSAKESLIANLLYQYCEPLSAVSIDTFYMYMYNFTWLRWSIGQSCQRAAFLSCSPLQVTSGRSKVLELLKEGENTYTNTPEMKAAVLEMEAQNPTINPAQRINSGAMHGTWKMHKGRGALKANVIMKECNRAFGCKTLRVFHAPHISNMSRYLFNTKFEPIIYRLGPNNSIISNVKFSSSLGNGWLSAAGTIHCIYDASVELRFERFWVDLGEGLREDVVTQGSQKGSGYIATAVDQVIGSIGRAAFFPQFAVFPIHYLDDELTVFEFTPLSSKISARRVGST